MSADKTELIKLLYEKCLDEMDELDINLNSDNSIFEVCIASSLCQIMIAHKSLKKEYDKLRKEHNKLRKEHNKLRKEHNDLNDNYRTMINKIFSGNNIRGLSKDRIKG